MTNLARRTATAAGNAGTRVLLVRRPVRAVGAAHEPSTLAVRLAIGVIVALGTVAAVWLMGFLGFHLGFAPLIGVGELAQGPGGSLIAGALILMSVPLTVLRAGMVDPLWLMLGFVAIAIPAGCLGAVQPASPGGPRPHVLTIAFRYAAAIAAGLFALVLLWWVVSPVRAGLIQPIPALAQDASAWLSNLRLAAGLDLLAAVAASLWVVLVMRLVIPTWLRGLSAGASFAALAIIIAAASISNGAVAQITAGRSVGVAFEGATAERVLLLGDAFDRLATLRAGGGHVAIELLERPDRVRVVGRQSIAAFLADHVEEQ